MIELTDPIDAFEDTAVTTTETAKVRTGDLDEPEVQSELEQLLGE